MTAGLEHEAVGNAACYVDNNPDPHAPFKPGKHRFFRVGLMDEGSPDARIFRGRLLHRNCWIVNGGFGPQRCHSPLRYFRPRCGGWRIEAVRAKRRCGGKNKPCRKGRARNGQKGRAEGLSQSFLPLVAINFSWESTVRTLPANSDQWQQSIFGSRRSLRAAVPDSTHLPPSGRGFTRLKTCRCELHHASC